MTRIYTPDDLELFARLEAATEGRAQLGAEVLAHVRGARLLSCEQYGDRIWIACEWPDGERSELRDLVNPTTSVDAALTLVPSNDWRVYALQESHLLDTGWFAGLDHRTRHYELGSQMGHAPTAALALCIAALKARRAA